MYPAQTTTYSQSACLYLNKPQTGCQLAPISSLIRLMTVSSLLQSFTKTNKGKFRKAENRTNRHVVILSSMYSFWHITYSLRNYKTNCQSAWQTIRQTVSQSNKLNDKQSDSLTNSKTNSQTVWQTLRQTVRQTLGQTVRQSKL